MIPDSYGIIAFVKTKATIKFLLYQRRDTFEYIEFIRGLWTDASTLSRTFSLMTEEERQRILSHSFDDLWNDFWVNHDFYGYKNGYEKAKRKYESIKTKIPLLIASTTSLIPSLEWGFPKGKKASSEPPLRTAIREFCEETKLDNSKLRVRTNVKPFDESILGTDGKVYTSRYFLGQYFEEKIPSYETLCGRIRPITISDEVFDLEWFKFEDAKTKLCPERQEILEKVHSFLVSQGR